MQESREKYYYNTANKKKENSRVVKFKHAKITRLTLFKLKTTIYKLMF